MVEERDWYGRDWKILRTNLLKLCLQHGDELLFSIKTESIDLPSLVERFVEKIQNDISQRISGDRLGLWKNGLSLFVNRQRLVEWLQNDRSALCGKKTNNGKRVQPRQALGRKLWQYFELARREQLAAGLGVSANKIKTWERLDRISRDLAEQKDSTQRCSEEHFQELAQLVKDKYSHDKNLPRKINTVQGYFYQFSDECFEKIDDREDGMDKISLQEAKNLIDGVGMAELSRCLNQLSEKDLKIIDVSFQLGIGKVQYLTVEDFLLAHSLSADEYEKRQSKIMKQLRDCLEYGLHEQIGGRE